MKVGKFYPLQLKQRKTCHWVLQNELCLLSPSTVEDTNLSLTWLRGECIRGLSLLYFLEIQQYQVNLLNEGGKKTFPVKQ